METMSLAQLQEFRARALNAAVLGHEIGLATEYMNLLAKEVGQEIVPSNLKKASAQHLLALADAALALRVSGKAPVTNTMEVKKDPKTRAKANPRSPKSRTAR